MYKSKFVLFMDDDPIRHELFTEKFSAIDNITHAYSNTEACQALTATIFDAALLDHDLGKRQATGYDTAYFIAHMEKKLRPKLVIIHSFNPVGADRMRKVLHDVNIESVCIDFGTLVSRYGPSDLF